MKPVQTAAFGVPEYVPQAEWGYRPRIQARQLRKLWRLKQETGKPITELVGEALDQYLATSGDGG